MTQTIRVEPCDEVLRISDGAIIDRPTNLMPVWTPDAVALSTWVVSWYRDQAQPGGYQCYPWARSTPRGWLIPAHSATGDVIEFVVAYTDLNGVIIEQSVRHWWGWLNYGTARGLVLKGPYLSRDAVQEDAGVVVDMVKMNALQPTKSFELGSIDPTNGVSPASPVVRRHPDGQANNEGEHQQERDAKNGQPPSESE